MSKTKKWVLIAFGVLLVCLIVCVGLLAAAYIVYKHSRPPSPDITKISGTPMGPVLLKDGRKEFREGTIVRVSTWAGAYTPEEKGASFSLSIDAGRIGQVVGVTNRSDPVFEGEQVVIVKWIAQEWSLLPQLWRTTNVESFTDTINADWIEPIK